MSKRDDGGPAFPLAIEGIRGVGGDYLRCDGMSMRDYFAAKALPACYKQIARECETNGWPEDWRRGIADDSYKMADAMLAERSK